MKTLREILAIVNQRNEEKAKRDVEKAENTFLGLQLLEGEGLRLGNVNEYNFSYPTFHIEDLKDFQKIHRALGDLKSLKIEPLGDGRSRKIKKILNPKDEKFAHFSFSLNTVLPKGAKCKLKKSTYKYNTLVCENM